MARQPVTRKRSRKPKRKRFESESTSSRRNGILLIAVLVGLLLLTSGMGIYVWYQLGNVEISGHGIFAMVHGIIFSLALGIGLMRLVYYSHRHGID